MSHKKLRNEIVEWLKSENFKRKVIFSVPIQKLVYFNKSGMKHAISRNYNFPEIELKVAKIIPEVLSNSFYMGFEKNTKEIPNLKGVHNYYSIIIFEKEIYEIWLKVKETRDLTYFYDYGIIKKL